MRTMPAWEILSFRYTEPMTWWMNMDPSIPRTYDAAIDLLTKSRSSGDAAVKKQAEAVFSSGAKGADGRYSVSFQNQPWANGAVWILNPSPLLPREGKDALQADVVFDPAEAKIRYNAAPLSGEYLDSLEAHADVLDYRPNSLAASSLPPSFDEEFRPVIPQAFSTYEIARFMSGELHGMGKLLMANTTPLTYWGYMSLLDCAGTEVDWLSGGSWTPDDDDSFCYRRTLCYHKPYMLLQNTDFSKFGPDKIALYFKKCMFYGVYPSFFSADSSSHPYWENPSLYNRDRALFKATIPMIRVLGQAGWEPVTKAHTSDPAIFIERYGSKTWTLFNDSSTAKSFHVSFEGRWNEARDLSTGATLKVTQGGLDLSLDPGDCRILQAERQIGVLRSCPVTGTWHPGARRPPAPSPMARLR